MFNNWWKHGIKEPCLSQKLATYDTIRKLWWNLFSRIVSGYNYFDKKAPSKMFYRVLNKPLIRLNNFSTSKRSYSETFFKTLPGLQLYFKKRLKHRCFPVKISKFLKKSFFYITPPVATSVLQSIAFENWS